MCVEITKKLKKYDPKERYACKLLHLSGFLWRPVFINRKAFRRGDWEKAQNKRYGFNCFATRRSAEKYRRLYFSAPLSRLSVRKIRIRKIQGFGYAGIREVIFAREIFVP